MLLKMEVVRGIVEGRIRSVYRRWAAARAKVGGRQRTPLGELRVEAITEVDPGTLTNADAVAAGYPDRQALLAELGKREGRTWRIDLAFAGEDPRLALREQAELSDEDLAELVATLDRKDRQVAWTRPALALIGRSEGVRAEELAAALGQEKATFKRRVRQLKELGLTISLERGYALSPRGRALLSRLGD